jgi:superfamily II DNA/RNA helicase
VKCPRELRLVWLLRTLLSMILKLILNEPTCSAFHFASPCLIPYILWCLSNKANTQETKQITKKTLKIPLKPFTSTMLRLPKRLAFQGPNPTNHRPIPMNLHQTISTKTHIKPTKRAGRSAKRKVKIALATQRKIRTKKVENSFIPLRWKLASHFSELKEQQSFKQLGMSEGMLEAVKSQFQFQNPSIIQSLAIPTILSSKKDVVMAAETGSGKTLAYLLPVFNQIKLLETPDLPSTKTDVIDDIINQWTRTSSLQFSIKPSHPRAIILVPSKELVKQVTTTAKQLSYGAKLRVVGTVSPGSEKGGLKSVKARMNSPMDLLVTTPAMLEYLLNNNLMYLGNVRTVVLDEADTMFDKGFQDDLQSRIVPMLKRAAETQDEVCRFIVVTATLPKQVHQLVNKVFPDAVSVYSPSLHKPPKSLHQRFLNIQTGETKQNKLLTLLRQSHEDRRILIFCNGIPSTTSIHAFLKKKSMNVQMLHSDLTPSQRRDNTEWFLDEGEGSRLLVATDLGSRGIDTTGVSHVILYDFPTNPINYLHRVGRTGRLGGERGRVTSLVSKRDKRLADTIRQSITNRVVLGA